MLGAVRSTLASACALVAAVAFQHAARATASPWSDHGTVAVRLVAGLPAGDEARLGLHFRLAPGWHVYWKHPGDAGAPPEVAVAAAAGVVAPAARLLFPAPTRFRLPGGLEALGYEGEVLYPLRLAGPAPPRLAVGVDYVACAVECIPYHDDLEVDLPAAPPADADEALLRAWEGRLPLTPAAARVTPTARYVIDPEPSLMLTLAGLPAGATRPELFLEPTPGASFGAAETTVEDGSARFRVPVRADVVSKPPDALRVAWTVTGLPSAEGPRAVAAVAELATGGTASSAAAAGIARAGGAGRAGASPRDWISALLLGALLALNPAGLAVLLLPLVRSVAPDDPAGQRARWRAPAFAALGMAAALAAIGLVGRTAGIAAPLAEPALLAALALPALALALALWLSPPSRLPAMTALAAGSALLALPWLPLAGWTATPPLATASALVVGFAVPSALASSLPGRARITSQDATRALGFLAAGALVWGAFRLGPILPTVQVAAVEISWLTIALCAREASTATGARRIAWLLAALAAGAGGVWLAGTPAIL